MTKRTLVVGGTGPTGPPIVAGLERRNHEVVICHTGGHEIPEVAHLEHIHCDVRDQESFETALAGREFDTAIVSYGRLRMIAPALKGKVGHFVSIGGGPAYAGYFDASLYTPAGMPVPTPETAPLAREGADGKSQRVAATEQLVFEHHPDGTHFRYPYVYGPRQLVPREWSFVRRILDGRSRMVVADGGRALHTYGYVENLAHAVLLATARRQRAAGQIFNCGDDEVLTVRQVGEICATTLNHEIEFVNMPAELATPARPLMAMNTTNHRVFDTSKLRNRLGYQDIVPAREAVALTAQWLADNPPAPGGQEEQVLEDPFNYEAEDALMAWWDNVVANRPSIDWPSPPGFGLSYAGPGTSYERRPG